jgi:hypothetical protein
MVDRNDIDALLIGSLYGELSSADEARLKAHLESHPADRTALDGLTCTRDAVRASRIFDVQVEPPQSVSALLLQEAARRAPRESAREGWFVRLRRSFLMSPAMAAAAMLVLVIGVAGTLYLREGDHFAQPEIAAPEGSTGGAGHATQAEGAFGSAAPAPAAPTTSPPVAAEEADKAAQAPGAAADTARAKLAQDARRDADGSYRVGLADEGGRGGDAVEQPKKAEVAQLPKPEPRPAPEPKRDEQAKVARQAGPGALLEVTTPRAAPKDLDDEARSQKLAVKGRAQIEDARPAEAPMAEPAIAAAKPAAPATRALDAAAPATAGATAGIARAPGAAAGGGAAGAVGGAYGGEEKSVASDGELAWAREQHTRLIGQVRAGHCTEAAGIAVALSSRAPGYYQQNVENDRSVKTCLPYITAERERAAERARARAATVRGNYEPAATAQKQAASKKAAPAKPAAADRAEPAKAAPATTQTQTK